MATSTCPECGEPVPNTETSCATCGRPTSTPPTTSIAPPPAGRSVARIVAMGAAVVGACALYYWWIQ